MDQKHLSSDKLTNYPLGPLAEPKSALWFSVSPLLPWPLDVSWAHLHGLSAELKMPFNYRRSKITARLSRTESHRRTLLSERVRE